MTTEIAVLNKMAVALAADSAVTIGEGKVYNTVNKLFTLSKYEPVGVMVYGNAEFMGVPWETIIKTFRQQAGRNSFPTLPEYAQSFLRWLQDNRQLFTKDLQAAFFAQLTKVACQGMRADLLEKSSKILEAEKRLDLARLSQMASEMIVGLLAEARKLPPLANIPPNYAKTVSSTYRDLGMRVVKETLENLQLSEKDRENLLEFMGEAAARGAQTESMSGLVIAGFGTSDVFPAIESFTLEGILCDVLPYQREADKSQKITHQRSSGILPFAQTDEAITFVEGASPTVTETFGSYIQELARSFPQVMVEDVKRITGKDLTSAQVEALKADFEKHAKEEPERFAKKFREFQRARVIGPLLDVVAALPKEELGAIAESIVTLTSLKRKFSMSPESVGGPVDVAVISKGDGFVWIKRKHYFDGKLNPNFMANYFREPMSSGTHGGAH